MHSLKMFIFESEIKYKLKKNIQCKSANPQIRNSKFYRLLFIQIFFISVSVISACKNNKGPLSEVVENNDYGIKNAKGFYVCADRSRSDHLLVDRSRIGEWEKFKIVLLANNNIAIKASNNSYVSYGTDLNAELKAINGSIDESSTFIVIQGDSNSFYLKTKSNKFVGIGSNGFLSANQDQSNAAILFWLEPIPEKKYSSFTFQQLIPLAIGLIFLLISFINFLNDTESKLAIYTMLIAAFFARLFISLLSNHLHWWDEQYHALVAKNLMEFPLKPMLYKNPVLAFDYKNWYENSIWLHKQPLFLWQIAMSLKIFGINTFALRLPSVVMSTLVTFFIFRIGQLTVNGSVGYFAGLLFAFSNYTIELSGGAIATDHNDVAFLFYICASIWAWIEYEHSHNNKKIFFLVLVGLFSGCAVLVKWLTGLLVYVGWSFSILLVKERIRQIKHYKHIICSFIISLIIFIPWQIYIHYTFPLESRYEFLYNARHFYEVLENHGGDYLFHLNISEVVYGVGSYFLILSLIGFSLALNNKVYAIAFFTYLIIIYVIFSLAATKMTGFTYCISFIIFLSFGKLFEIFYEYLRVRMEHLKSKMCKYLYFLAALTIVITADLNWNEIKRTHTTVDVDEFSYLYTRIRTTPIIRKLSTIIDDIQNCVIFNCRFEDKIPIMFYSDVLAAYDQLPDEKTLADLKQKNLKIAVFDNDKLPDYIRADSTIIKVDESYWKER